MQASKQALDEWKAGWPLPLVAAVGIAAVNMPAHSLGMFFGPLERELGWGRAQTASGILALSIVAIFAIPLIGRLVDLKGARRIALPGVIFFCSAFAVLGLAQPPIWSWWAVWMLLGAAASWISPVVLLAAVTSRFDKGRGLALAVTLSGAGVGTAAAPLLANWLIGAYGWRLAYAGIGAILCAVMLPLMFLFFFGASDLDRRSPGDVAKDTRPASVGMSLREALRNSKFLRLTMATFLIGVALMALVVHFVPILTGAGISTTQAAEAAAFIGAGSIIGRVLAGLLLDRVHGTIIGSAAFSIPILASLSLMLWGGDPHKVFAIAFLLGISLGSEVDVIAYLTSRYVGLKNFGALFGIIMSALTLAAGVGPSIGGLIYDTFHSYRYLLIGTIPIFVLAIMLVATLGPYPGSNNHPTGH